MKACAAADTEKLEQFAAQKIDENRERFFRVPYVVLVASVPFALSSFQDMRSGTGSRKDVYNFFLYVFLAFVSLLFRLILPLLPHKKYPRTVDYFIFAYIEILCVLLVAISVFDSWLTNDLASFATFFFCCASFYRMSRRRIATVVISGLFVDTLLYWHLYGTFNAIHILTALTLCGIAVFISRMQESMHAHLFDVNRKMETLNHKLKEDAFRDPLTNLYNRRYMAEFLSQQLAIFNRSVTVFSVIMGDIDHFKHVNDQYGHPAGDCVLKDIASIISSHSRDSDLQTRYGGEEFLLILPQTSRPSALIVAERIRKEIGSHSFPGINENISASFGVTEVQSGDTTESLIKRVDSFLYCAKNGGRNQCIADHL